MPNSKSAKAAQHDANLAPVGALKLKEARQYLGGISALSVHRLVARGLLKPNRCLRHLIFPVKELDRFLSQ